MRQRAPQHGISDYQKCSIPLKAAGQLRTAEVTKAAERIFGDIRAHLCVAKPIRRDRARCEARDFLGRCRRTIGSRRTIGPSHDWAVARLGRPMIGAIARLVPPRDWCGHARAIVMGACGKGRFCPSSYCPFQKKEKARSDERA